ncbi:coiled-coil domain-containing protein [Marinitoga aeolica]|uniref:Uncharacterized protein n=1 Tax=Marinitoga aeolica TaxID=2809031 RepID=A0ABY8PRD6_9BACT|nr:hypothetical protein [Marinitoga aeolica]WGS65169.1 hypothetical protein JRV97_01025 [Marinitoga aeolica]
MRKRWIYTFINFKKPNIFKILAIIVIILSSILSYKFINYNINNEKSRIEYDPRKTIKVNYQNVNDIETNNNPDNLKVYFNDDKYIHIRNEKNLKYSSIPNFNIKDFSVYKDKSVILDTNNNVYIGDSNLKIEDTILKNNDNGPSKIGEKIYQYKDKIVAFDGNIFLYDTNKNYWTSLTKRLNIEKNFQNIYFKPNYFITTTATEMYVFNPKDFTVKRILEFKEINDISLDENDIYIVSDNSIYKYSYTFDKKEKVFTQNNFMGKNILGVRYQNDKIYLLTDYGLSIYKDRTWKNIKIDGIKKDFYVSDEIYVITNDKIYVLGNNSYNYDDNYFFDGKTLYFRKGNDIYKIENKNAIKYFEGYKGKFEDFNPDEIVESHFKDNKLILISKNSIYVYDFEKKEYKIVGKNVNNILFNKNIYYLSDNKLYMYDLKEKRILAEDVHKYDVFDNVVYYIDSKNRLNILQNNKKITLFEENYDFDLKSLIYLLKLDKDLLLVNKQEAIILNLENYKIKSKIEFEDEIENVKKYDEANFALIGKNKIYFFENSKIIKEISRNNEIVNTRGDYIVLKDNNEYYFYDKYGKSKKFEESTIPFEFSNVEQLFALKNEIYFRLKTGEMYKYIPKLFLFNKLNVKYNYPIEKINEVNNEYYCISNNTLYKLFKKEKIKENVVDYIYLNNKFYYLTVDNYIKTNDENLFDNIKKVEGNYLSSYQYNNNLYLFFTNGIEKMDLNKYNISTFDIKIKDVVVDKNYAYIINEDKLHYFNLDLFTLENSEAYANPSYSVNNNELYIKENHKIYNISNNQKNLIFDFNPLKYHIVKNVYYYNNKLYFLGNNFYAIYSPDNLKWEYLNEHISIVDSNFINNKIYIKKYNGEVGYLDNKNFIKDEIPDFNVYNNYNGYFININQSLDDIKAIYKNHKILLVLTNKALLKYNIMTYSWKKLDDFSYVLEGYPEKDGMIIIQKNKITKYNNKLEKKEINIFFSNYWYSDNIVLYSDNKYMVYDKDLNKIYEKSIFEFPKKVDKIYYIDNYLYLISNKTLYVYSKTGFSKYTYYNPEFLYIDNNLFVINNGKVYKFEKGKESNLYVNVKSFVCKNNNCIYSDYDNNVYINGEKFFNYNIEAEIEYFYPIDKSSIIILDKRSNIYIYDLVSHNVVEKHRNNKNLDKYQIIKDVITKNKYLFWQSSKDRLYYYDISNDFYDFVDMEDNIIDYTVFNSQIYIMTNKEVKIYNNKKNVEKTITLPDLPDIKYVFRFKDNYYIKDEKDNDYLINKNLLIEEKDKVIDNKYLIYNIEIFSKGKELYDQTGIKLQKPLFNEYFEYDYKIGNYLVSTKNKVVFNLKDFSSWTFKKYEIHSNFIRIDDLLITDNGIKSLNEISEISFNNILIKPNVSIEKAITLTEEGKKEKEKIINKYNNLLEKEKDIENLIDNTKSELSELEGLSVNATAIKYNNLTDLENLENLLKQKNETIKQKIADLNSQIEEIKQENERLNEIIKTNDNKINEYRQKIEKIESNKKGKNFLLKLFSFSKNSIETLTKNIEKLEKEKMINSGKVYGNNQKIDNIEFQKSLELEELKNIQIQLKGVLIIKLKIYEKEESSLKNELSKFKDLMNNFHYYYPQYVISIPKYRINGKEIIDFSGKEEIVFEKYDFISFKQEIMQYSYNRGYLQHISKNNNLSIRKNYKELETYKQYMKKFIKNYNYIYFEDNNYFEKGSSDLKTYNNIFMLNGKTYILANNKILGVNAAFSPYSYGSLKISNTGNVEYTRFKSGIYYNNIKINDYIYKRFSLKNNEIIFEGNFFAYDISGNLISKNDVVELKDQIDEKYKIVIGNKLSIAPTNKENSLKIISGKLYFDAITKVAYNNYAYVLNVGIINLNTLKYIYLGNIDDLITADNGVFVNINGKIFKIENDVLKEDSNIIYKKQAIYFDSKFKSFESNNNEYYYFNKKMDIDEFYNNIYNTLAKPLNAIYYNNNVVFNNSKFLYKLNNIEIQIVDKNNYKAPMVIKNEIVDLANIKNYPEYLKKYSVNIDIDNGILETQESSKNALYYNNKKIEKTKSEDIISVISYYNSKYIITRNYIFELKDNNLTIRQKLKNAIGVKRILDYLLIILENEQLIFSLKDNSIEKYNNQKLSLDLDEMKMKFDNYDIKFANKYYSIRDAKISNEIFGLENVINIIKKNEDYYFLLKSNNILKKYNNKYELYKAPFEAKSIDLIKNEIILNKKYIFNEGKYKELSEKELISIHNLKDLMYKNNELKIVDSNDMTFNYYNNNIKTKRLFFDEIFNIKSNYNKLEIIANNGVYEYEAGRMGYKNTMNIEKTYKLFDDIIIKSNKKYYIFDDKINKWDGRIYNSIVLNPDYTVSNIYDLSSNLYLYQDKENINITFNDYFDIKPIGDIRVSIHNNNIMVFKDGIYINKIKENVKSVFLKEDNIIAIDSKNNEYLITKNSTNEYKTDEFDFWSFDFVNNKLTKVKKKVELKFNGSLLNDLNNIKPIDVFEADEIYIENKYGISKSIFRELIEPNNIVYKKRINDSLLIKTKNKDFRFNMPELKNLNVKISYDGTKFTEELSENFEFKYQHFSLDNLILNGVFIFDIIKDFNIDDTLYISNNSGTWKKTLIPYYLSTRSLDNYFVKDNKLYNKLKMKKSMLNAALLEIYIDPNMNIEERIKSSGDYIKIKNMEKSITDNIFVFDKLGKVIKTDELYNINQYGIFSKNHIIKFNSAKKILNAHDEYLKNQKKFIVLNGKTVDYSPKKLEISDNKWIWDTYENKLMFINKFNPNLKRVYLNNHFYDDIIIDIYIDQNKIYMRDKTGYVIVYENSKPINMEKYRNQKLKEFENDIIFSSKKYKYIYKNNKFYVEKKGDD